MIPVLPKPPPQQAINIPRLLQPNSTLNTTMTPEEYDRTYKEIEREILRNLLSSGKLELLENSSLHLYDLNGQIKNSVKKKEKDTIVGRLKARRRRMEAKKHGDAAAAGSAHAQGEHDDKEHQHDTTNEDIALFMLICMLAG